MATSAPESFSSVDWQTTKQTVRDRTAFLFNNSLMSDIKFVVTDSQQETDGTQVRVPAHKFVLAIGSPVFEAMFYGDLAEKGDEIELPDTQSNYLLEFLRFLYCDADEVRLTTDNAFGVLYLAQKYIVPILADKCWSFIDENTCACLKSDRAVSTLNHGNLVSLVQRDNLHVTKEVDLFDALNHWAEAKAKEEDLEPTGEAVRKTLGEALKFVRFPTISPQDFARQVATTGVLTDKDAIDMHQYFYGIITARRDIKFSERYRAGITSAAPLYECCRSYTPIVAASVFVWRNVPLPPQAEDVQEIDESLDIMVEPRNVHLKGVHLITSTVNDQNAMFTAEVRLLDEDGHELAAETGNFLAEEKAYLDGLGGTYGIVVKFKDPILIWKSSKYTLQVKLQAVVGATLRKIKGSLQLENRANDISFTFKGTSCSIYKLLFYKLG